MLIYLDYFITWLRLSHDIQEDILLYLLTHPTCERTAELSHHVDITLRRINSALVRNMKMIHDSTVIHQHHWLLIQRFFRMRQRRWILQVPIHVPIHFPRYEDHESPKLKTDCVWRRDLSSTETTGNSGAQIFSVDRVILVQANFQPSVGFCRLFLQVAWSWQFESTAWTGLDTSSVSDLGFRSWQA